MLRDMLQAAGFAGNVLSLLIVRCIFRMGSPLQLTFLNQMFLIYYAIDAIVGSTEIHFLFKLKEERYEEQALRNSCELLRQRRELHASCKLM